LYEPLVFGDSKRFIGIYNPVKKSLFEYKVIVFGFDVLTYIFIRKVRKLAGKCSIKVGFFVEIVKFDDIVLYRSCKALYIKGVSFSLTRSSNLTCVMLILNQLFISCLAFIELCIKQPDIKISLLSLAFFDPKLFFTSLKRLSNFNNSKRGLKNRFLIREVRKRLLY
jgi:hypothetical protein